MYYSSEDIAGLDKLIRINLVNSVTGIKPANLIATTSSESVHNVAIFSSVIHIGSNPPLLGFVLRPKAEVMRDTWRNIEANGCYTINHIHRDIAQRAHYTSAKFSPDVSEFERCDLTPEFLFDFAAPFVAESRIRIGLRLRDTLPIDLNDTMLVIGEIEHLSIAEGGLEANGLVDLQGAGNVGICGLNGYYSLEKIVEYPYARPEDLPAFK